jgi:hypothetical protein
MKRRRGRGEVDRIMYSYVGKCKNNKIKILKRMKKSFSLNIVLSEISQVQKTKNHVFSLICEI